jgi:flagellar basal body-associated protein FliL
MKRITGEQGEMNVLLIPVILLAVLLISAGGFAFWAYGSRENYKTNADALIATAVSANTKQVQTQDATQYAQAAKSPLTVYTRTGRLRQRKG